MPDPITDLTDAQTVLTKAFASARNAVVLTGAGLSTESGIPDFRSPGGIWSQMAPITYQEFVASEEARLMDWSRPFDMAQRFEAAEPNAAHRALTKLAIDGPVKLIATQNIDGLHQRAGTPPERLITLHGSGDHAKCLDCGLRSEIFAAKQTIEKTGVAPRCARCGGLVKAAVISFGEAMPVAAMAQAEAAAANCDLFVAAGTSLVVYPAAGLSIVAAQAGARVLIVSQAATEQDHLATCMIRTPVAATFTALLNTI